MSWTHFERMAAEYESARPSYPQALFEVLRTERVIGPGLTVLEVGAGAGLATRELVAAGSRVTALEPGPELATLLEHALPETTVVRSRLEDAALAEASFDSAVAATSMHWVDLPVGLSRLHSSLRPGGMLAVFRNVFGDDTVQTEFRDLVDQIVVRRPPDPMEPRSELRPSMAELASGGLFEPVGSRHWRWEVQLTTSQVAQLFRTFSDWTDDEVRQVAAAADACGGHVVEHYQSVLHLLRRA